MGGGRSESEKEKTKIRERQRRAITTNIFQGLRKHGGYNLSPRADINQLLRHLAREAGWVVEPDGTTYRSNPAASCCPLCGAMKTSAAPTPTSSTVMGGGDCSTTGSPHHTPAPGSTEDVPRPIINYNNVVDTIMLPLAPYVYGVPAGPHYFHSTATTGSAGGGGGMSALVAAGIEEGRASSSVQGAN